MSKITLNIELTEELEYLRWFRINADFGPGEGDYINHLHKIFEKETGNKVPKRWEYE